MNSSVPKSLDASLRPSKTMLNTYVLAVVQKSSRYWLKENQLKTPIAIEGCIMVDVRIIL